MKKSLTLTDLLDEAKQFSIAETMQKESKLFGITDGKAIGTYLEHKFQAFLQKKYNYVKGSSSNGIDFPELMIDMKVTSIKQPQSSCPFQSAKQKIYGLGYSLLIFVYEKQDEQTTKTAQLNILHTIFVAKERTADFQMTSGIVKIIENQGNKDDLIAFFAERMLPIDEIEANILAEQLLKQPPLIGYLTISNALQWRLQYSRVIEKADTILGITKVK